MSTVICRQIFTYVITKPIKNHFILAEDENELLKKEGKKASQQLGAEKTELQHKMNFSANKCTIEQNSCAMLAVDHSADKVVMESSMWKQVILT